MDYKSAFLYLKNDIESMIDVFEDKMSNFYTPDEYRYKLQLLHNLNDQIEFYNNDIGEDVNINENYRLKGWDWWEIGQKLNIDRKEYEPIDDRGYSLPENDIMYYHTVKHYLMDHWEEEGVLDVVREHLKKMTGDRSLEECRGYDAVWSGMLQIENDSIFIQFLFALLNHMWT